MDKLDVSFPISKEIIEENIMRVREGKPLTIPLMYLKRNDDFLRGIEIKRRKILFCERCNKLMARPKIKYCSDKCKKEVEEIKYNSPIARKKRNNAARDYHKRMMKESPNYNTKTRIRDRLRDALRHFSKTGKIRKSNEYLDYVNIIKFLGPCPGNRKDYHIDHINPLCNFDFNNLKEIQKAFSPENHQWLLIEDNIKKGKTERTKKPI